MAQRKRIRDDLATGCKVEEEKVPAMKPSPPCESCTGLCCTNKSGWSFVHLTEEEQANPVFAGKVELHEPTGKMGFAYEEDACPFLDRLSKRCTIYHDRPKICREFDCRFHAPPQFFRLNPSMVDLITSHDGFEYQPPLA